MEPREARRQRTPRPVRREFLRTMRRKNSMARRVRREFMPRAPARSRRTAHPLHRARRFYDRDDPYAWRQALPVGRLVAIRWRLRARCPAGEDDLHRSARRRRRGSLDVALRDALKLRRCWRLLWRRTVGKRVWRVDGRRTVRAGPAVHARSRAPVRDRLVGDLGDVASTGAPRVGTRLAGKVNRRYRSSPAAIGSPSSSSLNSQQSQCIRRGTRRRFEACTGWQVRAIKQRAPRH